MESFVNLILNNAQTVRDGGLISSILQNVKLINNSNVLQDVMPYLITTRMTGGYVAALLFGIFWILLLISSMAFLFYLHCTRSKSNFNCIRKFQNSSRKKGKKESISYIDFCQMFAIIVFLIPTIILLCFCISNVSQIHNSIVHTQDSDSTEQPTSILPAVKKSVVHVHQYLSTFPAKAREDTVPIVDEIIQATKDMQKKTMASFHPKLMRRIGVDDTLKYGKSMTNIVVNFFDVSNGILDNKKAYEKVINSLYPPGINPSFGLFYFITAIRNSFQHISNCDAQCQELRQYFSQSFTRVTGFPDTTFATSFIFVMKQQNKTRQSVIDQSQHGTKQMEKTKAKTEQKMKKLLDIDGTIRNMTGKTWTDMEKKVKPVLNKMDQMIVRLSSSNTTKKVSGYSSKLVVVLIMPIMLAIIVVITALVVVYHLYYWSDRQLNVVLHYCVYLCLILVACVILTSTIMFLYGGKLETELCRYIRTKQPLVITPNETQLVLDQSINSFLNRALPKLAKSMPKSEFPLPKPRNIMYGLIHQCRKNEPILAAIQAIDTMDTAAMSKPEVAAKFIRIGRQLLIESLNETDPNKMMPPDMKNSLQQGSQLDMFAKIDIDASINLVSRTPIFVSFPDGEKPVSIRLFLDRVDKYFSLYATQVPEDTRLRLINNHNQLLQLIENFTVITDRMRSIFNSMRQIPPIKPIVTNLNTSLENMLAMFTNKTGLFQIANEYFNKYIVASTPKNAASIMAKFGPKIMGKLGHCRPIFEAYRSVIDTTCDVIIIKLNIYWLYLGTVGLLLTCLLVIVYLAMVRTLPSSSKYWSSTEKAENGQTALEPLKPNHETKT